MATTESENMSEKRSVSIPYDLIRNPDISHKAVRVFCFLRSCSSDEPVTVEGVARALKSAKSTVGTAIRELEACGYLQRVIRRDTGSRFRGVSYIVRDAPSGGKEGSNGCY